jgi:2-keto-4-pentenoate hydratase/2-oxohepta-3-ene-1,7-dioic acid hydratase in catechol pathway
MLEATGRSAWALANLAKTDGPLPCLEVAGKLHDLSAAFEKTGQPRVSSLDDLFLDWTESEKMIERAVEVVDADTAVADALRAAPVAKPGKIMCAGANYFRHLEEMGVKGATKENQRLFFFMKAPRNAVVGEGGTVNMPLDTDCFDWEVELAVVIGARARAVTVENAISHVAGFTVAIDFSARDLNRAPDTFYKLDWVAGKAQESCCPLGPRFVPASALKDPQDLALELSVNGEKKQDDNTSDMIFSIAEQIAQASRIMTLHPGDVILTGTPAGVGAPRQEWLKVGDKVEATIAGIGTLSVTIQPPLKE